MKGASSMGRDDKKGKSKNKGSLPQTPKSQKIAPNKMREEISQELSELDKLIGNAMKNSRPN